MFCLGDYVGAGEQLTYKWGVAHEQNGTAQLTPLCGRPFCVFVYRPFCVRQGMAERKRN